MTADLLEHLQATMGDGYTLEREIGGGGMSRVFLATETALGRRVVVKLLPPELGTGLDAERFRREVRLAAELQHPHIVPLLTAGDRGGLLYYTMPYVAGETLRARLERAGELPVGEALRLLRDVADALAYAHRRGVVHRDLKPANVLLEEGHAVVIDFGVAKALSAAADAHGLTSAGVALGTPAYMAPEQAAADPMTDHRADLYAFGVLAYEMLAGQPPFMGRTPSQLVAAHLTRTPEPLTARRPGVPRELGTLVMRCLEKLPADRPQSAEDVLHALDTMASRADDTLTHPTPAAVAATSGPGRIRGRRAALAAGLSLAALTALVTVAVWRRAHDASLVERRVVVVPLDNQTGDTALAVLGRMAAEWTTQGLAQAGILEVVDARTAEDALATGGRLTSGVDRIRRIARATRARTVVSGAYYLEGDTLRFHAEITDAAQGRLMRALDPTSAPVSAPRQAITVLRQRILGAVATLLDSRVAPWTTSDQPPSLEAYRQWTLGIEAFRRGEFTASVPRFLEAARIDSNFLTPVIWAAAAYGNAGNLAAADSLVRVVALSRERLLPADRSLLDYWIAVLGGHLEAALDAARVKALTGPKSPGAALVYGGAALTVNRPHEAIAAYTSPDVTVAAIGSYPPFWEQLAFAHHLLGEYRQELDVATRGRKQHPEHLLLLSTEIRALAALGRTEEVAQRLDDALLLPPSAFLTPGQLMEDSARELLAHGKPEAAHAASARALAWYAKQSGPDSGALAQRLALVRAMYTAGRYEEARAIVATLPGGADNPAVLGYQGVLAARRGDRPAALAADTALAALRDPYLSGTNTLWRARIAAVLGERERAVALLRAAFDEGQGYSWLHGDPDFLALRDDALFRDVVRPRG